MAVSRTRQYIALVVAACLLLPVVVRLGPVSLVWQVLLEFGATLTAALVGGICLIRYYSRRGDPVLLISIGFIGAALLDGYSTLLAGNLPRAGTPVDVLQEELARNWALARLFLAIALWLSWYAWFAPGSKVFYASAILALVALAAVAAAPLPSGGFVEVAVIVRPFEFYAGSIFALTCWGYLRKGAWRQSAVEHWLVLALLASAIGQLLYMPLARGPDDAVFIAGHLFKLLGYLCALVGVVRGAYGLFRDAEQARAEQSARFIELVEEARSPYGA